MIIKRIGVSCLKVSVARINQYVNTKLDVCWFFKPGACTNQVVHWQEMEFMSLGRKDLIVIKSGTKDIHYNSIKTMGFQ